MSFGSSLKLLGPKSVGRAVGWIVLLVWFVWLHAFQGILEADPRLGAWIPDLSLLLVVGLAARLSQEDFLKLTLLAALARISFCAHPAAAVLAGYLVVVRLAFALKSVLDVTGIGMRTLLGGASVLAMNAWLMSVDLARLDPRVRDDLFQLGDLFPAALSSAAVAFFFGPLLVRLPGLSPLRKARW